MLRGFSKILPFCAATASAETPRRPDARLQLFELSLPRAFVSTLQDSCLEWLSRRLGLDILHRRALASVSNARPRNGDSAARTIFIGTASLSAQPNVTRRESLRQAEFIEHRVEARALQRTTHDPRPRVSKKNFVTTSSGRPTVPALPTENYGGAKGLELIPMERVEVILVAPPAYVVHNNPLVKDGFGDWGFLVKYRMLSANEERGKYILTAFFQMTAPTGQYKNGATNAIIAPTIAYGKGFGAFDVQGTFGATLPTGNEARFGRTYPWSNAFQYHVYHKFWPEVEVNYTHFQDGANNGKTQVFMTPGLVIGRMRLWKRLAFTVGGGLQIATTHFHMNNHNGIFSVRFPF